MANTHTTPGYVVDDKDSCSYSVDDTLTRVWPTRIRPGVDVDVDVDVDEMITSHTSLTFFVTCVLNVFPGKRGDVLTVTGTGFADTDNEVTIGDVQCSVTSQTATAVVCTLPAGPGGPWPVKVYVPGKGSASGSANFTFQSIMSSISPASGSTAGTSRDGSREFSLFLAFT